MITISSSKCPNCQKTGFELVLENIINSNYKMSIIRCTHCKTAIGVSEPEMISVIIRDLAKRLGKPLPQ